jgi:hypothetical protein
MKWPAADQQRRLRHNIGNLPIVPRIFLAQSSDCDVVDFRCAEAASGKLQAFRRDPSLLLVGICCKSIFCTIPPSGGGARVQSDDHHVQANLPAAKTTTHTMRNRNIETAKLACFLNSLRPSFIRVVRRKNIERTKRKIGIAAAMKAMILKIIVHSQCRLTRSFDLFRLITILYLLGACTGRSAGFSPLRMRST